MEKEKKTYHWLLHSFGKKSLNRKFYWINYTGNWIIKINQSKAWSNMYVRKKRSSLGACFLLYNCEVRDGYKRGHRQSVYTLNSCTSMSLLVCFSLMFSSLRPSYRHLFFCLINMNPSSHMKWIIHICT